MRGAGRVAQMGVNRRSVLLLLLLVALVSCMDNELIAPDLTTGLEGPPDDIAEAYFPDPGNRWQRRDPVQVRLNPERLRLAIEFAQENETSGPEDAAAMLRAQAGDRPDQKILGPVKKRGPSNGLIMRHGFVVSEWGPTNRVDMAFGITESFLATLAGLAWDQGLIEDLDDPVGDTVQDGGYSSPHNRTITWRQSLQQISEWEGSIWGQEDIVGRAAGRDRELQAPGSFFETNGVRVNRLALSLLRVWNESLPDVLDRLVMEPIGASGSWEWSGYDNISIDLESGPVQTVSGGHWGGGLWINSLDLARFGYLYLRRGYWGRRHILSEEWIAEATTGSAIKPEYGHMWWLNASGDLFPDAPTDVFAATGLGDSVLYVDPANDLVVVVRWLEPSQRQPFIDQVLAALDADAPGEAESR